MNAEHPSPQKLPPTVVWWVLWFSMAFGLVLQRSFLNTAKSAEVAGAGVIIIAPLVASVVVRFFVLPRITRRAKAFPVFVAGVAMAEAGGLLGLFVGGDRRNETVALGLAMLALYLPFFILRRLDAANTGNPFRNP